MSDLNKRHWEDRLVSPREVMGRIKPGMTIFLGSGVAEPQTLIRCLIDTDLSKTKDLELIQLTSHGDALSHKELQHQNYRLKTFFSGWMAGEIISPGRVDLIPSRYSQIPRIIKSKRIPIDAAFIQITPPNEAGFCSLGTAVDIAREAMDQASLVVGEINDRIPFTLGDTIVSISDFDLLVRSSAAPILFQRSPVSRVLDKVAQNLARVIEDGDCISFRTGPLFEALARHLIHKRHIGIHSVFFTDPLMDLVKGGAVTNYRKAIFRGKSVASYALGTQALMTWLDHNPVVEFQGVEQVCSPSLIGSNANFVGIFHARRVDLLGRVAMNVGRGSIASGSGEAADVIAGAEISKGGRTVFGLPSRNRNGQSNILVMLRDHRNQFHMRESINIVVTEYGIANLRWRSIRERAQALIDIAHPDDREKLVQQGREKKILFPDQIYRSGTAHLYPTSIATEQTFKGRVTARFRAIKPSDEAAMRRLFYRLSDKMVYRRFFYPLKTMPHDAMQKYVNIDYCQEMSVVALVGEPEQGTIIAEARYAKEDRSDYANIAFVVDEAYHGLGIATYLYKMLIKIAKESGIKGFTAEVLQVNDEMMKVFGKGDLLINTRAQDGMYRLTIPFDLPNGRPHTTGPRTG